MISGMTHQEIREKFLQYFKSKGHTVVPSSSLLPSDASVLFTTAGMQQFKEYYTHPEKAPAQNVVSIQKCLRTSDIDEVGDESHLTFFEMLGNFSFGGYWKKEAIEYAHEFITSPEWMNLKIDYVSVFAGEDGVPADEESEKIWKSLDSSLEVKRAARSDNFWGPTGLEGPCGPTTEIYVNGVEVWNIVFNEYYLPMVSHAMGENESFAEFEERINKEQWSEIQKLKIQGIDTGMGLERLAMMVQEKKNIFETDLFEPLTSLLPQAQRTSRIIADHARAAAFLISEGVTPSNKDQGYVLRRLLRRIIVQAHLSQIDAKTIYDVLSKVVDVYGKEYPEFKNEKIASVFNAEDAKFEKTFRNGLKVLQNEMHVRDYVPGQDMIMDDLSSVEGATGMVPGFTPFKITAEWLFDFYQSFGFPPELVFEILKNRGKKIGTPEEKLLGDFKKQQEIHREKSRAGAEKKFGGHGIKEGDLTAGDAEEMKKKTRLHTATHVIVAALEKVLGQKLPQAGSDITTERLRFDFAFPRKITPEELKQAEDVANDIIDKDLPVSFEEMDVEEAFKSGAAGAFKHKYGNRVKVYSIGSGNDPDAKVGAGYFSRELCGGPHVTHTGEIGHIKIIKEESVSGGNRRIRAGYTKSVGAEPVQ